MHGQTKIKSTTHVVELHFPVFFTLSRICENQFLASLCLSVRMGKLVSHWMHFQENGYFFFSKISRKYTLDSNMTVTWRPVYIYDNCFLSLSYLSQPSCGL